MAADWINFINNVSNKLSRMDIKNNTELSNFIGDQYELAVSGKAQTPFGNIHSKGGNIELFKSKLKTGFDILYSEKTPTFEDKEKNELYKPLVPPIPDLKEDYDAELEFKKWLNENTETIKEFNFYEFHKLEKEASYDDMINVLVNRVISQNDGSDGYITFLYDLQYGINDKIGKEVYNKSLQILNIEYINNSIDSVKNKNNKNKKFISLNDVLINKNIKILDTEINKRMLQLSVIDDPSINKNIKLKDYIIKFTYTPKIDSKSDNIIKNGGKAILKIKQRGNLDLIDFIKLTRYNLTKNKSGLVYVNMIRNVNNKISNKISLYESEKIRFRKLQNTWISDLEKKNKTIENSASSIDPYRVMAQGCLDYWKSTTAKPFTKTPAVSPCLIVPPLGGVYKAVSYGNSENLARNLRRAWNNGKGLKFATKTQVDVENIKSDNNILKNDRLNGMPILPSDVKVSLYDSVLPIGISIDNKTGSIVTDDTLKPGVYKFKYKVEDINNNKIFDIAEITVTVNSLVDKVFNIEDFKIDGIEELLKKALNETHLVWLISHRLVAIALAFAFAKHLFELKFVYSGGIPSSNGPVPMVGFVPFVF